MPTTAQRTVARLVAAFLILVGGAIHLVLWRDGYRAIPNIGPLFMANVVLSAAVAVALVFRIRGAALVAAALILGSLAALVLSRTTGLLGFTEPFWTPLAYRTLAAEVGAMVALAFAVRPVAKLVPARVHAGRG